MLTERLRFSLPADEKERLRQAAASRGMSMSEFVRQATDQFMLEEEVSARLASRAPAEDANP